MFKFGISIFLVAVIAISISRRVRLSARYERTPKNLSPWSAMDKGIDPTEENS
jgi:hypothetical protein